MTTNPLPLMGLVWILMQLPLAAAQAAPASKNPAPAAPPPPAAPTPIPTLAISTYDSIAAKHGLGPALFPLFEKRCACKVQTLASGDGAQMLSRLQLDAERGKPQAQLVLGLDLATWERAKPYLETTAPLAKPPRWAQAVQTLPAGFVPFDYGVFAFMADQEQLAKLKLEPPKKLADLLKPEWRKNVILQDPRTSTPGLAFVLYADSPDFWPKFKSQWLTLAPGWDGAYALFLKKEAPLVWSYTTSQAYHQAHGDKGRYRALIFEDGNPIQVEGAALIKSSGTQEQRRLAKEFLEFLVSPEAQALIPETQWMFPARADAKLPASFVSVPQPRKIAKTATQASLIEQALSNWKRAIAQ